MMSRRKARGLILVAAVILAAVCNASTLYAQTRQDTIVDPVVEEPLRPLFPEYSDGLGTVAADPCGNVSPVMLAAICLLLSLSRLVAPPRRRSLTPPALGAMLWVHGIAMAEARLRT